MSHADAHPCSLGEMYFLPYFQPLMLFMPCHTIHPLPSLETPLADALIGCAQLPGNSCLAHRDAHLIDDGEACAGLGGQLFGVVLHHAFQTSGGLEFAAAAVCILGVDKLCDDATCPFQLLRVRVCLDHQLIDIACKSPHV